jgi:vancomycin permeability regulator SanA
MKRNDLLKAMLLFTALLLITHLGYAQEKSLDLNQLIGSWELDLTPENESDSKFAIMKIEKIANNLVEGIFYREGVRITEGRTNIQSGKIYVALVSGDNSGNYNTSFFLENGKLYGSTHSLKKDFLSVWVAKKMH